MNKDIENIEDIRLLVDSFYVKIQKDEVIGYIFTEVMQVNWDSHLPIMYSFWESILLDQVSYRGNPMIKHIEINKQEPLKEEHFERWMKLWHETVDAHFEGDRAEEAKSRAMSMGQLMVHKIGKKGLI